MARLLRFSSMKTGFLETYRIADSMGKRFEYRPLNNGKCKNQYGDLPLRTTLRVRMTA